MFSLDLSFFADCINSVFFGQVCDTCDGAAIYSLLAAIIRVLTGAIGIVAIIGLLVFGISYLKSGGDPAKAKKARTRLVNLGIGVVLYIVAFAITEFLLPGGIVNHPISSTDETASCPEISYTDTKIVRPDNPGTASGTASGYDFSTAPSPYAGTKPSFTVSKAKYNGKEYNYIEIKNATPYVYYPSKRDTFINDLKNIKLGVEGGNIIIIANAGTFNTNKGANNAPIGKVIQNGEVKADGDFKKSGYYRGILLVDTDGKVGYTNNTFYSAQNYADGSASYTDALTGATVTGKKVASASTNFGPIVINGKYAGDAFKADSHYLVRRERQIFCLKSDGTNVIISNIKNYSAGGWTYKQMAEVAIQRGCQFAYNLDGGGSTSTAWRNSSSESFGTNIYRAGNRSVPTFIVYTEDNLPAIISLAQIQLPSNPKSNQIVPQNTR